MQPILDRDFVSGVSSECNCNFILVVSFAFKTKHRLLQKIRQGLEIISFDSIVSMPDHILPPKRLYYLNKSYRQFSSRGHQQFPLDYQNLRNDIFIIYLKINIHQLDLFKARNIFQILTSEI